MSIAAIGNSHIVAIKRAFHSGLSESLKEIDFYPLMTGSEIKLEGIGGGRLLLKKQTSSDVEPVEFKSLVLSACGIRAARNRFVETDIPPAHPLGYMACVDWGYDRERLPRSVRLVSAAVFHAAVEGWIRQEPLVRLAINIASRFSCPIVMQPWPAPNRKIKSDADWCLNRWYGASAPRVWLDFFKAQYEALKAIAREIGPQAIVLDYPVPGPLIDGFMSEGWCHPDPFHANYLYGNLVLKQIGHVLNSA